MVKIMQILDPSHQESSDGQVDYVNGICCLVHISIPCYGRILICEIYNGVFFIRFRIFGSKNLAVTTRRPHERGDRKTEVYNNYFFTDSLTTGSNKTPENRGLLRESLDIPVEAIVIAPICIIVVLFLISLAVYTHCKNSATTGRGEIPSSSSETEQVQLNGLNEVAFHPIPRSEDEQTSNENALQDGLMRNNELKEEDFRDTGDRSFFSMSTL